MNYEWHYNQLIERAKVRNTTGMITESHHIIPRCLGGNDKKSNKVNLTPEEHFVAHQLLYKIHPSNYGLRAAMVLMSSKDKTGRRMNNRLYGWMRRRYLEQCKIDPRRQELMQVLAEAKRGVSRTEEVRRKMSESHCGKLLSKEHRLKISLGNQGKIISESQRKLLSEVNKGNQNTKGLKRTAEDKVKKSIAMKDNQNAKGIKHSDKSKKRMSEGKKKSWANKNEEERKAIMTKVRSGKAKEQVL